MNWNSAVDRQFAKLMAVLAILFAWVFQCSAQSQDRAGTGQKAPGKDEIIACRFSALAVYVDIEVKDQMWNAVPSLNLKDFVVYEDGVQQEIRALMQIGERSSGKYLLYYEPANQAFDGKRRKVRVEARTSDGRKLRVSSRLSPDPNEELSFKFSVYPQSYSIQGLPRDK